MKTLYDALRPDMWASVYSKIHNAEFSPVSSARLHYDFEVYVHRAVFSEVLDVLKRGIWEHREDWLC